MTSQPLVPDPYETAMVEVRQSSVPGAEEGLFARQEPLQSLLAFNLNIVNVTRFPECSVTSITSLTRRDVVPDTVLAFYNGVRSKRQKDGAQTWQNEANAYKIFDPTCKEGIVNIPPEVMQQKTNNFFILLLSTTSCPPTVPAWLTKPTTASSQTVSSASSFTPGNLILIYSTKIIN